MMRTLKFVMYLFYRYYSKGGTRSIPYFSALSAVVLLIYIHIFQVLIVLDKVNWLPMNMNDSKIVKYWKIALLLLPVYLLIWFLVRERDLRDAEYGEDKLRMGGRLLVGYMVLSMIVLFGLAIGFAK